MTLVSHLDRGRLCKLLGMLGSDHDGEVVSAARMANQMVRSAGATWPELLAQPPALPSPKYDVVNYDIVSACEFCLTWPAAITDWERNFLTSLLVRRRPLSAKQATVLDRIVERIEKFSTAPHSS